jgi:hypothetical protein
MRDYIAEAEFEAKPNVTELRTKQRDRPKPSAVAAREPPQTFTAEALQTMVFEPLSYLLPGLVPEGCVLCVSRPKLGKSWLVLDLGIATALNQFVLGDLRPASGEVLYLALEDGKRRLQRRLTRLLPTFSGKWPEGLTFATEWPRADQGGVAAIEKWIEDAAAAGRKPRLVIVDTLAQFRTHTTGQNVYLEDYKAIAGLQKLSSKHNLTIIIVHHDRKSGADDVFDTVSGSLGLTGAADTIMVMKRQAGNVTLSIRGRDVEGSEKAIQFNKATCRWTILGDAADIRMSDERGRVMAALEEAGEPLSVNEIVARANLTNRNAADAMLRRMGEDGQIERVKRGHYALPAGEDTPLSKMSKKVRLEPKQHNNQTHKSNGNLTQSYSGDAGATEVSTNEPAGDSPGELLN